MSKTEADNIKKIETHFLKKQGYFSSWQFGTITWTNRYSGHQSSVSIEVSPHGDEKYLRINYTQTNRDTDEKKDFDYKIPLTTTPCRYGGERYWFICPMYKSGRYCGRRVGTLYKDGDLFACRHCYELTYESRKLSGREKRFGRIVSIPELDAMREKVTRTHYRGRPTKKYVRYLNLEERFETSFMGSVLLLQQKSNKTRYGRKP